MQCNMLNWDSFKTDNETADSLWAVIATTRCHYVNESLYHHLSCRVEYQGAGDLTPGCQGKESCVT